MDGVPFPSHPADALSAGHSSRLPSPSPNSHTFRPTWDESVHLASGYAALSAGDYRVDPTHPPFLRIWAALPLLAMDVQADTSHIDRTSSREWQGDVNNDPSTHDVLGVALAQDGQYGAAAACFARALELAPDYAPALEHQRRLMEWRTR